MGAEAKFMEIKKPQVGTTERTVESHKVKKFIGEIKGELHKVHWTSREELLTYTKIVIIATFVFGMSIYFVDMLIQGTLNTLSFLLRLIAG